MKEFSTMDRVFMLIGCVSLILFIGTIAHIAYESIYEPNHCNCTVDFNGQQTSIEDALQMIMEGLSYDQADEVQIMINNSLNSINK